MQIDSIQQKAAGAIVASGRAPRWVSIAWLSFLTGCYASTSSVPDAFPSNAHTGIEARAATAKDDAHVLDGPVLERAAFVRLVLESNPTIEAARQGVRAALAREHQAGAFEDPMVELGVAPLSIASRQAPFGFEASLSQKLPWFGKRALETAARAAEAEAAQSDYQSVRRELAFTAVMLHQQYFVAARSLDINAAHVELMRAMRDAAAAQFATGRAAAQDALQAEAELAHMEHDAVILTAQRDITVAQMNELLHRAPELVLPPPPEELAAPPEPDAAAVRPQEVATRNRSDIVAVEQRAKAEQARADRAERDSYPDLTLSTSYNSMWDMPAHRWMIGLGFNLPIQLGARAGAMDEARAMRAQLEQEAARLRDTARTQVFVALRQLGESEHVLRLFETRLLPIARQRIDAARAGFASAQNPFMAVMDAERNLRGLELDYQKARAEQVGRRAELDRALGRIPGLDWKEANP
jgi:outer membrane protein TolC